MQVDPTTIEFRSSALVIRANSFTSTPRAMASSLRSPTVIELMIVPLFFSASRRSLSKFSLIQRTSPHASVLVMQVDPAGIKFRSSVLVIRNTSCTSIPCTAASSFRFPTFIDLTIVSLFACFLAFRFFFDGSDGFFGLLFSAGLRFAGFCFVKLSISARRKSRDSSAASASFSYRSFSSRAIRAFFSDLCLCCSAILRSLFTFSCSSRRARVCAFNFSMHTFPSRMI
mmetsp:Transcript_11852/g.21387  ORF Transcript_11852/g.21387 Transcript_11852/m.21387 type:complete len:228 (-) Transcript_11852:680-1363(-)